MDGSAKKMHRDCAPDPSAQSSGSPQQVIIVDAAGYKPFHAKLQTYIKSGSTFTAVFPPMDAVIGRNGMAPPGQKREGDGRTPSGTFPFLFAFGYAPTMNTKMPYRQSTKNDYWVDDPRSEQYNQWVHGVPKAASHEAMRRGDNQYRYGVAIGYNIERVPGLGSAIFLHVWRGPSEPTAGCVAVSEGDMVRLLGWLGPKENPIVAMGVNVHL